MAAIQSTFRTTSSLRRIRVRLSSATAVEIAGVGNANSLESTLETLKSRIRDNWVITFPAIVNGEGTFLAVFMLSFWARTSGTWINVATVLIGSGLGLLLRHRLPLSMQQIITQAVGILTLVIGFAMSRSLFEVQAGPIDGVILGLLALVIGGLLGEWWQLEKKIIAIGDTLKSQIKGGGRFTEGFVAASLLFCIGPMTVIGSLNNGLAGDNTLLTLKATMDGLAAIALTGTYGIGVGFSALTVFIIQGGLSLLAGTLATGITDPATDPHVLLTTGIGGMMIIALGLNLLDVTQIRVASFLPALAIGPIVMAIARGIQF